MPFVQGGPPEWTWERPPDPLKWDVLLKTDSTGQTVYELRVKCGLEIVSMQFFTREEINELAILLAAQN